MSLAPGCGTPLGSATMLDSLGSENHVRGGHIRIPDDSWDKSCTKHRAPSSFASLGFPRLTKTPRVGRWPQMRFGDSVSTCSAATGRMAFSVDTP